MEEIITSAFPFNLDTALNPAENEALPDFGNSNPIIGSTVGRTDIANTLNSETLPLVPIQIVSNSENIDTTLPIIQSAENSTNAVSGDTDPLTGIAAETTPFVGDLTETTTATITATASGSQTPPTATRPETVINGDFEISSNNNNAPEVGDGLDERTFWTFDFTQDPEVLAFQRAESITEAKLTLELKVIGGADTDTTGIEGSTKYVDSLAIRDLPPNEVKQITINLLDTYTSEEIIGALQAGEFGKFRMYYDDDAIVSGASLELSGEISPIYDTGVFTVGDTGQVTTDFLFDGNNYEGELALFSLEGMETLEPGSTDFIKEAARRALQNSPELGHIIISDATEGAKFSGATQYEGDFNNGEYLGSKTFEMNPATRFAVMLVPDSTVQDTSVNPDVDGVNRALFSVAPANPDGEIQFVKVLEIGEDSKRQEQGETFAFEDIPINRNNSDKDFNDLIFQVEGATGKTTLLDEVINPERDWRESKIREEIIQAAVDPEDLAGNTPREARKTLPSTAGKTYNGWVGSFDTDDYHSFSLGSSNKFSLLLDGLTSNANVEIIDIDENIVFSSENLGTTEESISGILDSGAYRVRVTSVDEFGTPYNLGLSIDPLIPGVSTSGSEELDFAFTTESLPLINLDNFGGTTPAFRQDPRFQGIDGTGVSTVIIDSGINLNHPFFGLDSNNDGIADRVIVDRQTRAGHDFADNDDNPEDATGHGSNVASIAAGFSADPNQPYIGVAPGANIIPLKVFPDAGGGAFTGNIEQALQWVIDNAARYNIASVNMSLGSDNFNTFVSNEARSDELQVLSKLGIIVVAASGNSFFGFGSAQGVAYPSADRNSLSIGAVWDGNNGGPFNWRNGAIDNTTNTDRITSFSQRSKTLTTLFAPGAQITGAGLNDTPGANGFTTNMSGTSMAAPHIAGMAVLAQQMAVERLGRRLSANEFQDLLVQTGDLITDGDDENDNVVNTGLDFRRVNMLNLAERIEAIRQENILRNSPPDVTVNIRRVTGDFDTSRFLRASDFYAILIVDGKEYRSPTIGNSNEITPTWSLTNASSKELVPITIRIREEDRFNQDDQIDFNPNPDSEDLNLLLNQITGDIIRVEDNLFLGKRGQLINLRGFGKDNKGTMVFDITAPPIV
ncbi:MAG: S8 family serine peptidase [Richelia sp. RM1_1_1]|nr:S8 family serine peptidase [Richelia sp. RM1_1_1]